MATNFLMDFMQKHILITAFIVIGVFLIIKFLILPYLDVKGIKKELNKTKTETQKALRSQLTGAGNMMKNNFDMGMFKPGRNKAGKRK
jgi:hypothetical protein